MTDASTLTQNEQNNKPDPINIVYQSGEREQSSQDHQQFVQTAVLMQEHFAHQLLDKDEVILLNRTLARALGLNKSLVIRQVRYWLELNRKAAQKNHFQDGCWWVYNTYQQWHENDFDFWSEDTIARNFTELEALGLIVSTSRYNKRKSDRTKWYTINYGAYRAFVRLWMDHGEPVAGDSRSSAEYKAFLEDWEIHKHQYSDKQFFPEPDRKLRSPSPQLAVSVTRDYLQIEKNKDSGAPAVTPESDEQNPSAVAPADPEPPPIKPPAPTPDPPAVPKASRPRNPWYDAVYEIWGYVDNLNGEMQKMLQGKSKHRSFKSYNLSVTITPEELLRWAEDYREDHLGGDEDLNMLENRLKIQSSITAWKNQHSREPSENPSAPKKPYKSFDPDTMMGRLARKMGFDPLNLTRDQFDRLYGRWAQLEVRGLNEE